ncbi:MAG: DUF177 domain-containing protein [Bacteroidales bacterium]|jgi:uncharacterized metal-binding protein YceD (DUF177 family)|nr:DUF177 domain-containing protein [Bacteroidales bacterium]
MKAKDYFKQFDVRFGTLAFRPHQMVVNVNRLFFEKHVNEDITDADIVVSLTINRMETMLEIAFEIQGKLISICDVCLEELVIPVEKHENLILKITGKAENSDDESIVYVAREQHSYNIEQILYEYIVCSIPIRKDHQQTGTGNCNPEMLQLIEQAKNKPSSLQQDERWDALKKIKLE